MSNKSFLVVVFLICATFVILIFSCCGNKDATPYPITYKVSGVNIIILDGCEYIQNRLPSAVVVLTHKGNCLNSIHRYNDTTIRIKEKKTNNIGQARDVIIGGH